MTDRREDRGTCFAAHTAVECALPADFCIEIYCASYLVCARHRLLLELKLERSGQAPRVRPIGGAEAEVEPASAELALASA